MSTVNSGPNISKQGLVLCLDAGNNKSYSVNRFQSYGTGLVTESVNFSLQSVPGFQRIAAGTVIGGYTVKPNDVVYSYGLGATACHFHGNSTPIPSGVYATFSFDYLVTGATNYPNADYLANFENYGGGALGGSIATANNLQNVWQRRTFTAGPTSSAGTQAMFLYPGACNAKLADSGTIYFRNPKVEFTNTDTGNSTFSASTDITTWYDISGNGNNVVLALGATSNVSNNGNVLFDGVDDNAYKSLFANSITNTLTLDVWVKFSDSGSPGRYIMSLGRDIGGATGGIALLAYGFSSVSSGQIIFEFGSGYGRVSSGITPTTGIWYNLTATADGANTRFYVNGTLANTASQSTGAVASSPGLSIGTYLNSATPPLPGTYFFNGNISSAKIYNRALTAAEISANYNIIKNRFGL